MTDGPQDGETENLWTRLRRRKVVQWGVAYAAGAWGFLQGLQYVSEAFDWPGQLRQIAILALLIGLPIVLVIAWYHGDRGEQRVSGTELAIITLLFLLGGGIFWRYERASEGFKTPNAASVPVAVAATNDLRPSIAVLPFTNRSDDHKDGYFVDGVHDDILTQLTKIGAMKVIAGTSVAQFRDTRLSTREIADMLGVTKVLEGGVQRAGDRVRVTVQLIDARTEVHLWAESYDRELTAANIFAIQSEVAKAIAGALEAALTPAERMRAQIVPTQKLEAWEAFQLGRQALTTGTSKGSTEAERYFREAIEFDPEFAPAYVGLAHSLVVQVEYGGAPRQSSYRNAEKGLAEALTLDPNLAEAWAASGEFALVNRDFDRAEKLFLRAIELKPNDAAARAGYSAVLAELSRYDESLGQIERANVLDPLSTGIKNALGFRLAAMGRFDEAEIVYRKVIKIDPSKPTAYYDLAQLTAFGLNRFADAVALAQRALELDSGTPAPFNQLSRLYFDLGEDNKAVETTVEAAKRWSDVELFLSHRLALVNLRQLSPAGLVQYAQRVFVADPQNGWALAILRNADLQRGHYDAAVARYEKGYPDLVTQAQPRIEVSNYWAAIDLALALQKRGDDERAKVLLDGAAKAIRTMPRLGYRGFRIADVQIHALRGQTAQAIEALREAERAGWRHLWRYYRDFDPNLASIRNEPEFKAVFADIERDMARQRAELAKRPKDALLDLGLPEPAS